LVDALKRAERIKWAPYRIRENAYRFDKQVFVQKTSEFIKRVTGSGFQQEELNEETKAQSVAV